MKDDRFVWCYNQGWFEIKCWSVWELGEADWPLKSSRWYAEPTSYLTAIY